MGPVFGEFFGTMILLLMGGGVCAGVNLNKSKAQNSGWIVITFGWGMAVAMAAYISSFMGPAHLNPAVTLAMAMEGSTPWSQVIPFMLAQLAGAMAGSTLMWLAYYPHWSVTTDKDAILGTFATEPAIRNYFFNVLTETIATFVLVIALLSFGKDSFADGLNTAVVGGLIFALGLSLGGPTGYAMNPARDLGARIMHAILPIPTKGGSDWAYSWVPIVGPFLGAIIAVGVFNFIK
jgi:Glycerol uptake facilitator and related permeases (Major Intrinsic Protein Family)